MILALLALACAPAEDPVMILAAASLTDALPRVVETWEGEAALSLDATSRLARQLEAGAPADLFVSADAAWLEWLTDHGLVDPSTRVDLLSNRLVVVVPAAGGPELTEAGDLAEVERLALAGETVPAGRYARRALEHAGVWEGVEGRVVRGRSVRTALAWVARGEAGAGVVYGTDALVEPRVRVALDLESPEPILYPAALTPGAHPEAAALLEHLASPEAAATWAEAGFAPAVSP